MILLSFSVDRQLAKINTNWVIYDNQQPNGSDLKFAFKTFILSSLHK